MQLHPFLDKVSLAPRVICPQMLLDDSSYHSEGKQEKEDFANLIIFLFYESPFSLGGPAMWGYREKGKSMSPEVFFMTQRPSLK